VFSNTYKSSKKKRKIYENTKNPYKMKGIASIKNLEKSQEFIIFLENKKNS